MKLFITLLCVVLFLAKLIALNVDKSNTNIKWGSYNNKNVNKCLGTQKGRRHDFLQRYLDNLFNTEWGNWDKLRPIAQQKMSAILSKESATPLMIFEWADHSVSYNSILLTDKFTLSAKSDSDKILFKKGPVSKDLFDAFNLNRKLLKNYKGHMSASSTSPLLYCVTIWKDKKVVNTFIFLELHLFNSGQYGSEQEKTIAKIFMQLLNSVQPKKKSQTLDSKRVLL